jgi:hypothetical protein
MGAQTRRRYICVRCHHDDKSYRKRSADSGRDNDVTRNMITQGVATSSCRPWTSLLALSQRSLRMLSLLLASRSNLCVPGIRSVNVFTKREAGTTVMVFQTLLSRWVEMTSVYIVRPRGHGKAGEGGDGIAGAFRRARS